MGNFKLSDFDNLDASDLLWLGVDVLAGVALGSVCSNILGQNNKKEIVVNNAKANKSDEEKAFEKAVRSLKGLDDATLINRNNSIEKSKVVASDQKFATSDVDVKERIEVLQETTERLRHSIMEMDNSMQIKDYRGILEYLHYTVSKEICELIVKLKLDPDMFKVQVPVDSEVQPYQICIVTLPQTTAREFFYIFNRLFDIFKKNESVFLKICSYYDFHKWSISQRYMFRDQMILADFLLSEIKEIKQTNCLEVDFIAAHQRCQIMLQHYSNMT